MSPVKIHSEDPADMRAAIAVMESQCEALERRVASLETKLDYLRRWQHTVLGASAVVLFVIGTWGTSLLRYMFGNEK